MNKVMNSEICFYFSTKLIYGNSTLVDTCFRLRLMTHQLRELQLTVAETFKCSVEVTLCCVSHQENCCANKAPQTTANDNKACQASFPGLPTLEAGPGIAIYPGWSNGLGMRLVLHGMRVGSDKQLRLKPTTLHALVQHELCP